MNRLRTRTVVIGAASAAAVAFGGGASSAANSPVPESSRQLVVAIAPDWDASKGHLFLFERESADSSWRPAVFSSPVPVLFGKGGLGWGRGLGAAPQESDPIKREGDRRAPAGAFRIGRVLGYASALPEGSDPDYPYRKVSEFDAWVEDPENPYYNRHVVVDPDSVPAWFDRQRMRHGDFAYEWLVEVRHNADPPVPGAGSAIFFHIRRGPNRATHGCTTMAKPNLEKMIRWLRSGADPVYVLLTADDFARLRQPWNLPPLAQRNSE